MENENKNITWYLREIIIDVIIVAIVGLSVLAFNLWGVAYERGFFCEDRSLKYTYKHSTVTSAVLYSVGYSLPIATIVLVEFIRSRKLRLNETRFRILLGLKIPNWLWEIYHGIVIFMFGVYSEQLVTGIGKYTIGGLRPHFFEVCNPDIDCTLQENRGRYIETYTCLGQDPKRLRQMRLSFPSGHASFSSYTMVFLALYLQKRFNWNGSTLLRHLLQLIAVLMAWYTGMTRVSDNKHHWTDVLAGFAIGAGAAFLVVTYIYKPKIYPTSSLKEPTETEVPRPRLLNT